MLFCLENSVLFFGKKISRNVKTIKILIGLWWRAFSLSMLSPWVLLVDERRKTELSWSEGCHLNVSKAPGPAAAFSGCRPLSEVSRLQTKPMLFPHPYGLLPLSSVIVTGSCLCSCPRATSDPRALEMC